MAARPLDPGGEVAVHGGDDFRSDGDDAGLVAFAEHPEAGGALGGFDGADLHGDGFTAADPGPGEHGEQCCIPFGPRIPGPGIGATGGLGDPFQLGVLQRLRHPLRPLRTRQPVHRIRQQHLGRHQVTPETPPGRKHPPHRRRPVTRRIVRDRVEQRRAGQVARFETAELGVEPFNR